MSKRLILVLAFLFVVGIAFSAYAEVQNVKVSGDLTVLGAVRNLSLLGPKGNNDTSFIASIARVKVDADLTDNVMATVRLLNERYWGTEREYTVDAEDANTLLVLDLAYATMKEFLYSPLTIMVGRQELHYGSEMIVGDPDTNNAVTTSSAFALGEGGDPDLTARKAFDAIRAVLNYDPLVIDAVFSKLNSNATHNIGNDDERLFGITATYALDKKTNLEGYWFQKQTGKKAATGTTASATLVKKTDEINAIGGRVVRQVKQNLTASLEAAYQFGKRARTSDDSTSLSGGGTSNAVGSVTRKAWALEAGATYAVPKCKMTPTLTALYAYFSGDHENNLVNPDNGAWRGWDPMYENQKYGDISNAVFAQTNAHILGGIATVKPMDDVTLKGEYYAYWWAKAYPSNSSATTARNTSLTFTGRRFVGQEIDLTAMYDYTEDVQFSLMGAMFVSGASIAKEVSNKYQNKIATDVIGSMKVTF